MEISLLVYVECKANVFGDHLAVLATEFKPFIFINWETKICLAHSCTVAPGLEPRLLTSMSVLFLLCGSTFAEFSVSHIHLLLSISITTTLLYLLIIIPKLMH